MDGVFLCYRRGDAGDVVGRIQDRLRQHFGSDFVFRDVDNIAPGADFRAEIAAALTSVDYVLVAIGPGWLAAKSSTGARRIDQPRDAVRIEIETALENHKTVIPLLVGGSDMPEAEELPESIALLADLNGLPIRQDPDFEHDVHRLFVAIGADPADVPVPAAYVGPTSHRRKSPTGRWIAGIAALLVVVVGGALAFSFAGGRDESPPVSVLGGEATTTSSPAPSSTATPAAETEPGSEPASTQPLDSDDGQAASTIVFVDDLTPGDCFDEPATELVDDLHLVPCAEPHDNEVFFTFLLDGGTLPSESEIGDTAFDTCVPALESYAATQWDESSLDFSYYSPTRQSWSRGDRLVICYAYNTDLSKLVGTVMDSGR